MGSYKGECFCGAVEIEVTGEPNAMGYCHCRSCRSWSGGPVNAFSLTVCPSLPARQWSCRSYPRVQ